MGKKKTSSGTSNSTGEEIRDERFTSALAAPIFNKIGGKDSNKVQIDDRFKSILTDERFRVVPGEVVDAYGRKKKSKKQGDLALKELNRLYKIEAADGEGEGEEGEDEVKEEVVVDEDKISNKKKGGKKGKASNNATVEGGAKSMEDRLDYLTKLARGEISGSDSSSDSDSDSDSDGFEKDEEVEGADSSDEEEYDSDVVDEITKSALAIPGDEDSDEAEYGQATRRISILNCDWENIKATDLMVILQSFCPPGKQVLNVTVYPSDFGKERMAQEAKYGPQGIWKKDDSKKDNDSSEGGSDEDDEENEDLYDNIEDLGEDDDDDEEGEGEEEGDWEDVDEEEEEEEETKASNKGAKSKHNKSVEFKRNKGAVGIVLHDDLVRRRRQGKGKHEEESDEEEEEVEEEEGSDVEDSEEGSDEGNSEGEERAFQKKTDSSSSNKKKKSKDNGFDVQKLREYELSKLRYYFAIAECDCPETAGILADQLDDVELQDTAMALEIRFVPDELDLSDREKRDFCDHVPMSYKPPTDFVVNALQHTNVKCTWDEGEKEREKKLTNITGWRALRDSDFMQYIASSDSEDEEEEVEMEEGEGEDSEMDVASSDDEGRGGRRGGGGSVGGASMMSISRKKSRAKSLRKLLLGDNANSDNDSDDDSDNDDDNSDRNSDDEDIGPRSKAKGKKGKGNGEHDDFFLHEDTGGFDGGFGHVDDDGTKIEQDGDEMVLTYIPEAGKDLLDKKRNKDEEAMMTPYELSMKRAAEKKKEKKTLRKLTIEERKEQQKQERDQALAKMKGKVKETEEEKKANALERQRLSQLIGEVDDEDAKLGDTSTKKAKKNRKRGKQAREDKDNDGTSAEALDNLQRKADKIGSNFEIDVTDDRFKKVFEGDSAFGIERTAHEFKETAGMKKILEAQRKNRLKKNKQQKQQQHAQQGGSQSSENNGQDDKKQINNLVNRLKRKFQE